MKTLYLIIISAFITTISFAQYSVQVGSASGWGEQMPCNLEYDYSWGATIYKQSEINSHGTITSIFYNVDNYDSGIFSGYPVYGQRVFMKLVTDNEFSLTAFPDTNQMTLVFSGYTTWSDYDLSENEIILDIPFAYDPNYNLMVLYINNRGYNETNPNQYLIFDKDESENTNRTIFNYGNGSFPGGNGTYTNKSPVIYLKYASGLDAGISSINNNELFKLPQQADLICKMHNYMADTITSAGIEWELNGTPQTTYNWAGNNYCGQDVALTLQQDFAFAPGNYNIKANTTNPNSGVDELNINDTLNINIRVSDNKSIATAGNYASGRVPFLSNASYGWSASIYNKDSINFSGQINAIAYFVNNTNGMEEPHQKIFIRTTPNLTNTSMNYPDTNLFTKVFDGEIDYTSIGWHIIEFDTVFDYNQAENLMILYENHAGIATAQGVSFKTGWVQTDAIYNYDSNSFPTSAGQTTFNSRVPAIQIYFSIPKDAGVIKLANSNVPLFTGNNDFIIDFKNFGLDTLQDIDVKYKIDNGTANLYHWNGTINPQNEITNLNVGTSNLNYGDHFVKIWTENPNFFPDYVNRNDTLKISLRACSPLSGTYTIGSAPSDFLTVKAAIDSLNNCGINGAVTFNIKTGTYNSQYILNEVLGSSATNTIIFQSVTSDSTDVVLTTDSTDYLFNLNGADYLRFKHLTFTSDSAEKLMVLDSGACNNIFENNQFIDGIYQIYNTETTIADTNNIINNNLFLNGNTAVYFYSASSAFETSNIISSNKFENQTVNSINNAYQENLSITNNNIKTIGQGLPIYSGSMKNCSITKNTIKSSWAAIKLSGVSYSNLIANNFIVCETHIYAGYSIKLSIDSTKFYNNTVKSIGAQNDNPIILIYGDNNDLKNNILLNFKAGRTIHIDWGADNNTANYNCLYTNGASLARWHNTECTNLAEWQSESGLDSNSISALPVFASGTDLHTNSIFVDNAGTPLALITDDIDGEPRNITTPDIGADEFTSSCNGPLSGNYTIGTTGDYSSFDNALQTLLDCGMDSSVVFNVETGNYDEQLNIDGYYISSDSSAWTITFQSQSGDSTDVVLQYDADSLNNYVVKLKTIENLIFKNMTFKALDTSFARVIVFEDLIKNIVISNNQIIGSYSISDDNQIACIYSDNLNEIDTMSINFNNNYIVDGSYGIDFDFGWSGDVKNNFISSYNKFYNQSYAGIYLNGVSNIQIIKNNTIESYNNPNYGIYSSGIDSLNISSNIISLSSSEYNCYGIENFSSHNIIANNFISLKAIQNAHVYGYYSSSFSILYNNTVFCYGDGNYYSSPVTVSASTSIITNNNLVNLITERVIYSFYTITSDYNNLYSNSSYFDFNDWQISTGMDSNSVSFMPDFVSGTDLHTNSALLYQTGIAIPEITTDIDGETRNNPPCIGADEFDNPVFNAGNDTVFCYYNQYFQENSYVYDIGLGYDSYQWSTGSDSSSISIDTLTSVGNNSYTVTVTIGTNTYSDTINILYDKPEPISNIEYCAATNDSILITANQYNYYLWNNGDTTQSIYGFPYYGYNIIVTDNYGCTAKSPTFYVENNQYPALLPDDTVICCNQSVELVANNYNESDLYNKFDFIWNTGDTTHTLIVDSIHYGIGIHTFIVSVVNKASVFNCESEDTIIIEIQDCIGIDEYSNDNIIKIYPNPATNNLTINSEKLLINNIEILDITGKLVLTPLLQKTSTTQTFDINRLKKGLYFIKIRTNNFTNVLKFIKK